MILVDSSAWISVDRADGSPADLLLTELIAHKRERLLATDPVLMEVLAGARTDRQAERLHRMLVSLAWAACDPVADFEGAARIYRQCRVAGVTPRNLVDCLIVAIALRTDAELLAVDRDFEQIARVVPLRLYPT